VGNTEKNELKPWLKKQWCLPPKANGEFVYHMEDVLAVYKRPYDPQRPQVCLDEASKQLLKDKRERLPMRPGDPEYYDSEYEREGVCNIFVGSRAVSPASFYEAFEPAEAYRLSQKLEIHYTPTHGSWLNMAEIELSVLARQCLAERMPSIQAVQEQVSAWQQQRNQAQATINWRFTAEDARIKLKRLYPSLKESNPSNQG
jgi:hypothetical protein